MYLCIMYLSFSAMPFTKLGRGASHYRPTIPGICRSRLKPDTHVIVLLCPQTSCRVASSRRRAQHAGVIPPFVNGDVFPPAQLAQVMLPPRRHVVQDESSLAFSRLAYLMYVLLSFYFSTTTNTSPSFSFKTISSSRTPTSPS